MQILQYLWNSGWFFMVYSRNKGSLSNRTIYTDRMTMLKHLVMRQTLVRHYALSSTSHCEQTYNLHLVHSGQNIMISENLSEYIEFEVWYWNKVCVYVPEIGSGLAWFVRLFAIIFHVCFFWMWSNVILSKGKVCQLMPWTTWPLSGVVFQMFFWRL